MAQNIRTDLKILVVGNSGAGKTSFVNRWTKNEFKESYNPTVVSEFGFKIHELNGKLYRIQLWDIGGQDKSSGMAKIFSRDSHGCVIISDSNTKNLEETIIWKNLISNEVDFIDGGKIPFILIENKIDLIENREEFQNIENQTKDIAENNNFEKYFMASVKQNINIEESMNFLIELIVDRLEKYSETGNFNFNEQKERDTIKIERVSSKQIRKEKKCC